MKLYALNMKLNDKTKSSVCPYDNSALVNKLRTFTYPKPEMFWIPIVSRMVLCISPLFLLGKNKQSDIVCWIWFAVLFVAGYLIPCLQTLSEILWYKKYSEVLAKGNFKLSRQSIDRLEHKEHSVIRSHHASRDLYYIYTGSMKILVERDCYARLKKSEYLYLLFDGDNVFGLIPIIKKKG